MRSARKLEFSSSIKPSTTWAALIRPPANSENCFVERRIKRRQKDQAAKSKRLPLSLAKQPRPQRWPLGSLHDLRRAQVQSGGIKAYYPAELQGL